MSTRSCIARRKGDGFAGVYHHWDGYPKALGVTLFGLAREWGIEKMLTTLIDEHPAGWSTINDADWSLAPGYQELATKMQDDPDAPKAPECFCHGERSEEPQLVTHEGDMGMEWAYVFDEEAGTMAILERTRDEGDHATGWFGTLGSIEDANWTLRGVLYLPSGRNDDKVAYDDEPDWVAIECGPNLEHCSHYKWAHDDTICKGCDGDGVMPEGYEREGEQCSRCQGSGKANHDHKIPQSTTPSTP